MRNSKIARICTVVCVCEGDTSIGLLIAHVTIHIRLSICFIAFIVITNYHDIWDLSLYVMLDTVSTTAPGLLWSSRLVSSGLVFVDNCLNFSCILFFFCGIISGRSLFLLQRLLRRQRKCAGIWSNFFLQLDESGIGEAACPHTQASRYNWRCKKKYSNYCHIHETLS